MAYRDDLDRPDDSTSNEAESTEVVALETEVADLREQARLLDAQVKDLVRSEQRLSRYQHELDRQLRRMHAVNLFALEATTAFRPQLVLECAMRSLAGQLALANGLGLLVEGGSLHLSDCHFARPGMEADPQAMSAVHGFELPIVSHVEQLSMGPLIGTAALLSEALVELPTLFQIFDDLFGLPEDDDRLYVMLPLVGRSARTLIGLVLMRAPASHHVSFHDKLPDSTDLPFLQLLASHLETTLENALLHERLSSMARHLERRVEERTAALSTLNRDLEESLDELRETQGHLFQAGKMAAVGTLVAGLSHELNTPLSIILGYTQTLLGQVANDAELGAPLRAIERQTRRCCQLVGALLDFSRYDPATRTALQAETLLLRVRELVAPRAYREGIAFVIDTSEAALPWLLANSTELESALLNLINNGLDAIGDGPGEVVLSARRQEGDGRLGIEFLVRDTGTGISRDIEPWIFDPFFTTKPAGHGTGLGLALTRRIVEAHEGHIEVDSVEGHGTSMRVWLPAIDDEMF